MAAHHPSIEPTEGEADAPNCKQSIAKHDYPEVEKPIEYPAYMHAGLAAEELEAKRPQGPQEDEEAAHHHQGQHSLSQVHKVNQVLVNIFRCKFRDRGLDGSQVLQVLVEETHAARILL